MQGAKAAFTTQQRRSTNQSRRAQRCYAQTEDEKRSLNFEANKRAVRNRLATLQSRPTSAILWLPAHSRSG